MDGALNGSNTQVEVCWLRGLQADLSTLNRLALNFALPVSSPMSSEITGIHHNAYAASKPFPTKIGLSGHQHCGWFC